MNRLTTCKEITKDTDMKNEWGYSHIYKKLAAYEDAEEQGRLIVLPCKVGDVVYETCGDEVCAMYVTQIEISDCVYIYISENIVGAYAESRLVEDFGDTIFLTRAEAEAALERRRQ